ncbi:TPA: hypothetical protein IAC10_10080 [Candidatus Scatousia excrementigallinarum]|uniref:AbiEi antitoxin C-terminal domain-containing protein n=1 Tax=Candidatus Scatousia excrementigallinarum TaxID=2840935 RepID=A0A9D1EZU7_9BACT|nr:hypothetical protein [Candidatus Scatousia excrementigallinarum]
MKSNAALKTEIQALPANALIEASAMYRQKFNKLMTEMAFYKALERMTKEQVLVKVSKGVYARPLITEYGLVKPSQEQIIATYTRDNKGMVVGYVLYNRLNISTQISKNTVLYSNAIQGNIKTIGNIKIERRDIDFTEEVCSAIAILEVLENYYNIQDLNYFALIALFENFAQNYDEEILNKVLSVCKYSKSTIAFLRCILDYYKVENNLSERLSALSSYRHPTMEEIYEFART